jgi:hypothetical protein
VRFTGKHVVVTRKVGSRDTIWLDPHGTLRCLQQSLGLGNCDVIYSVLEAGFQYKNGTCLGNPSPYFKYLDK